MKFRIIQEPDELTIVTEKGGVVCIRSAEPVNNIPRTAATDYYHKVISEDGMNSNNVFEKLAEGDMESTDWSSEKFNSVVVIHDALFWLDPEQEEWLLVDDLFTDILGPF